MKWHTVLFKILEIILMLMIELHSLFKYAEWRSFKKFMGKYEFATMVCGFIKEILKSL